MTVIPLQERPSFAAKALAASRANRDGVREIGGDSQQQRRTEADERLEGALRFFRTAYDELSLANVLETKLAAERRLAGRSVHAALSGEGTTLPLLKFDTAARSCASLLSHATEMLFDAAGVAKDGGLIFLAKRFQEHAESLNGELLPDIRALWLKLEAEAGADHELP